MMYSWIQLHSTLMLMVSLQSLRISPRKHSKRIADLVTEQNKYKLHNPSIVATNIFDHSQIESIGNYALMLFNTDADIDPTPLVKITDFIVGMKDFYDEAIFDDIVKDAVNKIMAETDKTKYDVAITGLYNKVHNRISNAEIKKAFNNPTPIGMTISGVPVDDEYTIKHISAVIATDNPTDPATTSHQNPSMRLMTDFKLFPMGYTTYDTNNSNIAETSNNVTIKIHYARYQLQHPLGDKEQAAKAYVKYCMQYLLKNIMDICKRIMDEKLHQLALTLNTNVKNEDTFNAIIDTLIGKLSKMLLIQTILEPTVARVQTAISGKQADMKDIIDMVDTTNSNAIATAISAVPAKASINEQMRESIIAGITAIATARLIGNGQRDSIIDAVTREANRTTKDPPTNKLPTMGSILAVACYAIYHMEPSTIDDLDDNQLKVCNATFDAIESTLDGLHADQPESERYMKVVVTKAIGGAGNIVNTNANVKYIYIPFMDVLPVDQVTKIHKSLPVIKALTKGITKSIESNLVAEVALKGS